MKNCTRSITEDGMPLNKGHYVYVLRCSDGTLYTGYTTEPMRRLQQHNEGRGAKYTRGRGPVELVYLEEGSDRSAAQKREEAIKRLPREQKERLIEQGGSFRNERSAQLY